MAYESDAAARTSGLFRSGAWSHAGGVTTHGLIFDLDGTLVDSLPGIANALNRALTGLGLPGHSHQAVRGFIGNGARVLVSRAAPAGTGESLLDRIEQTFKTDYDLTWPQGTATYPGVNRLLTELQHHGLPLAILSNKPHAFTTAMVQAMFPDVAFAAVLGQRPGIPHKPSPEGALEIAALLGMPARACTVIGDSTMDIETARRAGMQAVAVSWGYHDRDVLLAAAPDAVIDKPLDLHGVLEQLPAGDITPR